MSWLALSRRSAGRETVDSASLNSTFLSTFFLGIYTVVYFGTIYMYSTRKSSRHWLVVGTISLLYILYAIQASIAWGTTTTQPQNDDVGAEWAAFVILTCNYFLGALADALLVWRCFNVWGRSVRAISLAAILLVSEVAYLCVIVAKAVKDSESSSPLPSHSLNKITAGGLFLALATTLLLTSLISYRIHFTCKQDLRTGSRNLFKHIVEIIVQSAAAHALVTLMTAVCVAIPVNEGNVASVTSAQLYMAALYPFTAGIAPTIMVARVAFANGRERVASWAGDSTNAPVSSLQFDHGTSDTQCDQSAGGVTRLDSVLRVSHEKRAAGPV